MTANPSIARDGGGNIGSGNRDTSGVAPATGISWLVPEWPAPPWVRAASTTRLGGVSRAPFDSLNLGQFSGDDPGAVARNRELLQLGLELPGEPAWLRQVHGVRVLDADMIVAAPEADGSVARFPGPVCVVMGADCMPALFCDRAGTTVAAAHAGWRGLVAGVLEATVRAMNVDPRQIMAWLGPAIGPLAFEVGDEVRTAFMVTDESAAGCFRPSPGGRWLADLVALARLRLAAEGVVEVSGGHWCTWTDSRRFFSYRRTARTGRMASLVWLDHRVQPGHTDSADG